MLREAMLGVISAQANVAAARAQKQCVTLPVKPTNDRLQGPHGDSLVHSHCEVVSYQAVSGPPGGWITALYRWTSLFTAEDKARGPSARDTVTEDEAVVFEAIATGQIRPVWHERIETGEYGVWRSVMPELAWTSQATILLSVMMCLTGTGGCGEEFLQRHTDGRWYGVRQGWLDQLPVGFIGSATESAPIRPVCGARPVSMATKIRTAVRHSGFWWILSCTVTRWFSGVKPWSPSTEAELEACAGERTMIDCE